MVTTTISSTGHLAMFQIDTAVEPMPSGPATAVTIGAGEHERQGHERPACTSITSVTRICSGRSFQNGRPSGVS